MSPLWLSAVIALAFALGYAWGLRKRHYIIVELDNDEDDA